MLSRTVPALLLAACSGVQALQNASPFVMFSSDSSRPNPIASQQIASEQHLSSQLVQEFARCDDHLYILLAQSGLRSEDVRDASSMPKLSKRIATLQAAQGQVAEIPNVLGGIDALSVANKGANECIENHLGLRSDKDEAGWGDRELVGNYITMPRLPYDLTVTKTASEREKMLKDTDEYISTRLSKLDKAGKSYTLIYTSRSAGSSSPTTEHVDLPYEMDDPYPSALHTDLKRDLDHHRKQAHSAREKGSDNKHNNTDNTQTDFGLFEKYQFLTPALFMGLSVTILLLLILYVGLTAIAGLEVSYAAFSKDMGPQAQNKGKQ
ncbi:hypothetical protein KC331_g4827 [Hortaea werneckii]|nr:hypothetical protein KC331_g4827 [Hortaea werneckii]KAI7717669.1 hypothetical protein KC353_g4386 [Hortaea werneckii]